MKPDLPPRKAPAMKPAEVRWREQRTRARRQIIEAQQHHDRRTMGLVPIRDLD